MLVRVAVNPETILVSMCEVDNLNLTLQWEETRKLKGNLCLYGKNMINSV